MPRKTRLTYPKNLFTRKEVLREKKQFRFPKAWRLKTTKREYSLTLYPSLVKKHYLKKTKLSDIMDMTIGLSTMLVATSVGLGVSTQVSKAIKK